MKQSTTNAKYFAKIPNFFCHSHQKIIPAHVFPLTNAGVQKNMFLLDIELQLTYFCTKFISLNIHISHLAAALLAGNMCVSDFSNTTI